MKVSRKEWVKAMMDKKTPVEEMEKALEQGNEEHGVPPSKPPFNRLNLKKILKELNPSE